MHHIHLNIEDFKKYIDDTDGCFTINFLLELLKYHHYEKIAYVIDSGKYNKSRIKILANIRDLPDEIKIRIKIGEL